MEGNKKPTMNNKLVRKTAFQECKHEKHTCCCGLGRECHYVTCLTAAFRQFVHLGPLATHTRNSLLCPSTQYKPGHRGLDASGWVLATDRDPQQTTKYSFQVCQKWCYDGLGYAKLWSRIMHYYKEPLPWIGELSRRSYSRTIEFVRALATRLGRLLRPRLPVLTPVMCHAQTLKTVNVVLTGLEAWQKACEGLLQNQAQISNI